MIYLDNSATTLIKPHCVRRAFSKALSDYSANPGRSGHSLSVRTAEAIYSAREKICGFFGADDPAKVAFTMNCTQALNMVIKGVLLPGDHCIVSSMEHNAVMRPVYALSKIGVEYDEAHVVPGNDFETVSAFESLIKPNTKLIVCTHASNVWGVRMPIEKIGKMCHSRGILFAVDAAQSAGVLPIDMHSMNIDFLCVAPHKGLYSPAGLGIMIANCDIKLSTIIEGGTGTFSSSLEQPADMPERLESGTINTPGIIACAAGIDFVASKTLSKIHSYEMELIQRLYVELGNIERVELYTEYPTERNNVAVLSFNIKEMPSESAAEYLSEAGFAVRAGLHCAPAAHRFMGTDEFGAIRASVSIYNNISEIMQFARKIEELSVKSTAI